MLPPSAVGIAAPSRLGGVSLELPSGKSSLPWTTSSRSRSAPMVPPGGYTMWTASQRSSSTRGKSHLPETRAAGSRRCCNNA